ncbi:MAG TPA: arylsulfatase [Segetibacter sp.]
MIKNVHFKAFVLLALVLSFINTDAQKKPNIIIIVADDLGWNDVGFHNSEIITPNLDAFVKKGIELQRFYVRPICSPTRAGIMTGKYPDRLGVRGVVNPRMQGGLPAEEQTLAELLATAGYKNRGAFGKWHLGHSDIKFHPLQNGFTRFYGHYNGAIDYYTHYRNGALDWHDDYKLSHDTGYSVDLITKKVIQFINESGKDPFFAYVALNAPHAPLQGTAADLKLYGYDPAKGTGDYNGGGTQNNEYNTPDYGKRGRGNTARQTLSAMITSMDRAVGEIMKAVNKKGIAENTIIWFTTDNGGAMQFSASNLPLKAGKETEWEGGVRGVAAVYWKGKWEGGKPSDQLIGFIDVFPTIAATTGAKMQTQVDGINVAAAFKGKQLPQRTLFLGKDAVVTKQWKLKDGQLFNLSNDISETLNVAAQNPEIVKKMNNELSEFKKMITISQMKMHPADWRPDTWEIKGAPNTKSLKE